MSSSLLPIETRFTKIAVEAVPASRKQAVLNAVRQFIAEAETRYRQKFEMPTVSFDQRGTTAGMAYLQKNHIRYNPVLLNENFEDFLATTTPHEVAHLVAHQRHGRTIQAHGPEWRQIMVDFGVPPARCHSYDVSNARVGQTVAYRCGCKEHSLSSRQHKKIQRGQRYVCKRCRQALVPLSAKLPVSPPTIPRKAPSERMLAYLRNLVRQHKEPFPAEALADAVVCSQAIDRLKGKAAPSSSTSEAPTERQLAYATAIAHRKQLSIPPETLADRKQLSQWIDQHKIA